MGKVNVSGLGSPKNVWKTNLNFIPNFSSFVALGHCPLTDNFTQTRLPSKVPPKALWHLRALFFMAKTAAESMVVVVELVKDALCFCISVPWQCVVLLVLYFNFFPHLEILGGSQFRLIVEIGSWRDRNLKIWPKL